MNISIGTSVDSLKSDVSVWKLEIFVYLDSTLTCITTFCFLICGNKYRVEHASSENSPHTWKMGWQSHKLNNS